MRVKWKWEGEKDELEWIMGKGEDEGMSKVERWYKQRRDERGEETQMLRKYLPKSSTVFFFFLREGHFFRKVIFPHDIIYVAVQCSLFFGTKFSIFRSHILLCLYYFVFWHLFYATFYALWYIIFFGTSLPSKFFYVSAQKKSFLFSQLELLVYRTLV